MTNFCTLFDSNYLARGLAMHESLINTCTDFHLYVLAFDDLSLHYLLGSDRPRLTVIALQEFEDPELLKVKAERTNAEYCWTSTPSLILYCIEKFGLSSCTYVDADMIFYHDPQILIDEAGKSSVIISEHRYTKEYDVSATHGVYCVQFMYFSANQEGLTALRWWRERCLEWCYAYLEDGKFGDQKYLDDWTTRFTGVHVLRHEGGGLAPWNLQQFSFVEKEKKIFLQLNGARHWHPLVFFHFHGLKFYTDEKVSLTGTMYEIDNEARDLLFFPYVKKLLAIEKELLCNKISFNPNGAKMASPSKMNIFAQFLKERLLLLLRGKISLFQIGKFDFRKYNHYYSQLKF